MTKVNQLDFTGTTIFCGLDVHKVSWRVNLRDIELELKDFTQPADASLLHKHLTKNYPGATYKAEFRQPEPKYSDVNSRSLNVLPCLHKTPC